MNIAQRFLEQVEKRAEDCALVFRGGRQTYAELAQSVAGVVEQLQAAGVKKGDIVTVQLPNGPVFAQLFIAAAALGCVLAPVASSLQLDGIARAIERTGSRFFIGLPAQAERVSAALNVHAIGLDASHDFTTKRDWHKVFTQSEHVSAEAPYILTMTSGSTGDPKPILLTQETKLKRMFQGAVDVYGLREGERVLVGSPMYHSLAMRLTLLPLMLGGTAVILPQFSPLAWLNAVRDEQVTFTIAVSTHLEKLAPILHAQGAALKSLRCLVSSSALLRPETKLYWLEHFHGAFHECYGASEIGIATNLTPEQGQTHLNTVGKPLKHVDLKILDSDRRECATGEIGEIACRSETVFSGYLGLPEATEKAFHGEYFLTGDLGYLDEEGFLYLSGRKKEVIMVGGINVYPKDIEEVIGRVEGVREVAVVGRPDPDRGEKVVAYVAADPEVNEIQLRQACMYHLADFQQPSEFVFVDELPKNDVGKLNKRLLSGTV